jgi:hypothetical protein
MKVIVSFTLRQFHPRERLPNLHWRGGWLNPNADLHVKAKRRICLSRESNYVIAKSVGPCLEKIYDLEYILPHLFISF